MLDFVKNLVSKVIPSEQVDSFFEEVAKLSPESAKEKILSFLPSLPVADDVKETVTNKLSEISEVTVEHIQSVIEYIKNALGK